jgi:hypothetical protein
VPLLVCYESHTIRLFKTRGREEILREEMKIEYIDYEEKSLGASK